MRCSTVCSVCNSSKIVYLGKDHCYCENCNNYTETKDVYYETPYERTRNMVYVTGNKWAIENFNATH